MEDKSNIVSSAYGFLAGLFNKKSSSRRGSIENSTSSKIKSYQTASNPTAHINGNSLSYPAPKSPFIWNETEESSVGLSTTSDLHDALPSPRVLPPRVPVPRTPAPPGLYSTRYYMQHERRGIALIINNREFAPILGMPERKGTDLDADALTKALEILNFDVKQYNNLGISDMDQAMKYYASLDHGNSDCFFCVILTHGDDGIVYGKDGKISIEKLMIPFKGNKCLTLAGKPKVFIVQACRGDKFDRGVELVEADGSNGSIHRLPAEADFLFAFSTIPGFYSWRNTDNGSWFIQALSKMILVHYGPESEKDPRREPDIDFVRLLTRVHFEVAYFYKSNVPANPDLDQQKQIPSIVSMLTRDLHFPPKTVRLEDSNNL